MNIRALSSIPVIFSQTIFGKIIVLVLFALPLAFVLPEFWKFIMAAIVLLTFFPKHRWVILFFCNPLFWIFTSIFRWDLLRPIFKQVAGDSNLLDSLGFRCLLIILTLMLNLVLINFLKKDHIKSYALFILILFYLLSVYFLSVIIPHGTLFLFTYTLVFLFCKFFWFLLYAVMMQENSFKVNLRCLLSMQPFWCLGITIPVPGSLKVLERAEAKTPELLAVTQIKALKLIYWVVLIYILFLFFNNLLYPISDSARNLVLGITQFIEENKFFDAPPRDSILKLTFFPKNLSKFVLGEIWTFHKHFMSLIVEKLVFFGIIVSIARMAGFYIFRHVYKPFSAKTFIEFIGRFYYYNNQLILRFFFLPIYKKLDFIHSNQLKKFVAIALSLFGFGVIHIQIIDIVFRSPTSYVTPSMVAPVYIFYCIALAITIAISEVFSRAQMKINILFNIFFFYFIFRIITNLQVFYV